MLLDLSTFIKTNNPFVLLSPNAVSKDRMWHLRSVYNTDGVHIGWTYLTEKGRKWCAMPVSGKRFYCQSHELAVRYFERTHNAELAKVLAEAKISLAL